MTCKALIRSKTDYGSIILKNANTHYLKLILQYDYRSVDSSPVRSRASAILQMTFRPNSGREKLLLFYSARIKRNTNKPANKTINSYIQEADKKKEESINNILERKPYTFTPRTTTFNVNLTLTEFKKENTMPFIRRKFLKNILQERPNSEHIHADASKTNIGVGPAIVINDQILTYKLHPQASNIHS